MTVPNAANGRSRRPLAAAMSDADVEMEASSAIPVATKPTEVKRVHSLPMKVPKVSSAGSHIRDSTAQEDSEHMRRAVSESALNCPPSGELVCSNSGATLEKLCSLFQPATEFERNVLNLVQVLAVDCVEKETAVCSVDQLGRRLRKLGYQVWVRQALSGGSDWFKQLSHSFLLVEGDPKYPDQLYVVDPNFRDQFIIARQTPQYEKVMMSVPQIFVGRGKKLLPAVQLLCSEMSVAFSAQQLEIPPWRKNKCIMSKWMPQKKTDYVPEAAYC